MNQILVKVYNNNFTTIDCHENCLSCFGTNSEDCTYIESSSSTTTEIESTESETYEETEFECGSIEAGVDSSNLRVTFTFSVELLVAVSGKVERLTVVQ